MVGYVLHVRKVICVVLFVFYCVALCFNNEGSETCFNVSSLQSSSYCAADLRLCFRICKKKRFSHNEAHIKMIKALCSIL